jgi:hypothetical protein
LLGCGGDGKSRHKAREEAIRKNLNSIGVPKDVSENSVRIDFPDLFSRTYVFLFGDIAAQRTWLLQAGH